MKKVLLIIFTVLMLLVILPSCGSKTTTTPVTTAAATTPAVTTAGPAATTLPETVTPSSAVTPVNKGFTFASTIASFFYDFNGIQGYYNDGLTAMSGFQIGGGTITSSCIEKKVLFVNYVSADFAQQKKNVPPEYSDKLPPDGAIPAPPGACPAAAEPTSKFKTKGGDIITPDLLKEKDIKALPADLINASQEDPSSLRSLMSKLVPVNDMRLGTAEGWNELLWDKLKEYQVPAESLMDYQMWTVTGDLEQEVVKSFRESLLSRGLPQMVINAFDESAKTGWYSSTPPTEADALAQMDITAKLTGSVSGTVHEWRDFSIPGLGQNPVFGVQKGDGIVTMNIPDVGKVDCSVDINLDQFDEQGRAIGGTVVSTPVDYEGFKIVFTYKPDGSKDGVIFKDGEEIGYLTMTTDAEKFTNYVDIKEGTELKLPEDGKTLFQ
jgi:hypothetical protein